MNGSAHGHGFIRVHVFAWLFAEELFHLLLHFGHARHTAHQNDVVNVGHVHASVLDGNAARGHGALDQLVHQAFQLGTAEFDAQVLRACGIGGDVGQVDVGASRAGQFDLGFFSGFFQALQGQHVFGQINAAFLLEFGDDEFNDALVKVFATQEGVAVGGQDFKLFFAIDVGNFDDGHVKRTATQVIHCNLAIAFVCFVQAKSQGSSCGFVDDALDIQPSNAARVFGGLALCVIEISRHRDDGFCHFFAEIVFGRFLHLAQHFSADLRRCQFVAAHFHPCVAVVGFGNGVRHQVDVFLNFFFSKLATNQALHGIQRVAGVGDSLTLGGRADQNFAVFLVRNDGRCGACAFGVLNHLGGVAFHDGHTRIGGA